MTTTFHIDDDLLEAPPFKRLQERGRLGAIGMWALGGSWTASHDAEGFVPEFVVRRVNASRIHVDALLDVGLWYPAVGGYRMGWAERFLTVATAKPKRKAAGARGTRIPDDFALTDAMREFHAARFGNVDVELETEKFVNYWQAKSGAQATKVKWGRVWENWIITASERAGKATAVVRPSKTDRALSVIELGRQRDAARAQSAVES